MSADKSRLAISAAALGSRSFSAPVLDALPEPPAWVGDALCAQIDPEMFFPEKGGSTREAKKVCASCDVREQCLAYALEHGERFGIWGGVSERDRRKLERGKPVAVSARQLRLERISELRSDGLTPRAIAQRVGMSEGGVRRALGLSQ